jgi:hypothetical protein
MMRPRIYAELVRAERVVRPQIVLGRKAVNNEKFLELCRSLWHELHIEQNPTPEWFAGWLARVPNFGCNCRSDFKKYLETNPPRYDDWYAWSVEAHNWVNARRGKPIWAAEK